MDEVRFDGRVAIVTGAGRGLGRAHALALAGRGARVVVNDLGVGLDGDDPGASVAAKVVAEIEAAGGEAVASVDAVDDPAGAARIVQAAMDVFGRVDVVVNNAGILRDVSFGKMPVEAWDAVVAVHLRGTMLVTRAAWPHLRERGYGRIVNATSAAGLYGNFGQASYAAAKMGTVGLTTTLAQEGARHGILANVIAPVARSRMTETIFGAEVLARLDPAYVTPVMLLLASERCAETGQIYAVGGGYMAKVQVFEGAGVRLETPPTPETLLTRWSAVGDMSAAAPFASAMEAARQALK